MAILDEKREALVVRIVYDGPPLSGKTTTLRALSAGLSRTLESPQEFEGRTLYFDWLDYTAGRFEGRPIRCQVVSVPGQRSLAVRRRGLLKDADSIVFVADTGSLGMELSLRYARELSEVVNGMDRPRPGIVIQANKRDVDDALPAPDVLQAFRSVGVEAALIETTATDGSGVRDAFLFGVRLALDRVRELTARGLLQSGRPAIDSSGDLLRELTGNDGPENHSDAPVASPPAALDAGEATPPSPAGALLREALASEEGLAPARPAPRSAMSLPDASVPSGFIWPPIEGRIIVQQMLATNDLTTRRFPSGDYSADSPNGWRVHSRSDDLFKDQNVGRSALVDWARHHVRNQGVLSDRRCIVLSPDGGGWRLWQIVGASFSLEQFLAAELHDTAMRRSAEALLVAAMKLIAAVQAFNRATMALHVGLPTVAANSAEPRYIGVTPGFDPAPGKDFPPEVSPMALAAQRLSRHITGCFERFGQDRFTSELEVVGQLFPSKSQIPDILLAMLHPALVT